MERVLIVDDDVHVCETLRRLMEHAGFQHRICQTAAAAVTAFSGFDPDAAILDFVLPDTDGITLAQTFKSDHPDLRIIMVSGFSDFEETLGDQARAAGVNIFVEKPFRAKDILDALRA